MGVGGDDNAVAARYGVGIVEACYDDVYSGAAEDVDGHEGFDFFDAFEYKDEGGFRCGC